ncbi:O-succinylhomoserine sulfhydrylase [Mycobacterium sp.]|uniref:O-succinylhomoserine sulfhydrylase n=1 Tax=Mycobacterium sp. TaxID=1785 RepID=UPI003BAEB9B5
MTDDDDAERSDEVGVRPLAAARLEVPPPACGGKRRKSTDEPKQVPSVRTPLQLPDGVSQATIGVRGGILRSQFDETAEAMYLASGYVYGSSAEAEQAFTGEVDRYVYSRYGNPTISMFEERLRLIEGAPAAFATASGMAAVFTSLGALLAAGDRLVASRSLFGSCFVVCSEILPRWGVETVFVDGDDLSQWEKALSVPTQAVFFETPSNPMQSLVDIAAVTELAHAAGAKVVLDNVFATPLLQQGFPLGVDVVVYSGTKHIDGQGRVLGGAILGDKEYIDGPVQKLMRHTGPAMSAFNAWVMLKGLETLSIRVDYQNASAERIAEYLEGHSAVRWVRYPFLTSHPQYDLAKRQMSGGGTVVTFELDVPDSAAKQRAFEVLDKLQLINISNNLGDSKSLVTHPATTTHRAMGPEGRAAIGLGDGVVRISVGLESTDDLIADIDRALS